MKQQKEDQNAEKKIAAKSEVPDDSEDTKKSEEEKKDEQDVVFVQDVGFTIKITAPGVEPFDIQVWLHTSTAELNSK